MLALVLLAIVTLGRVAAAHAACPQVVTDCLGTATNFKIVAEKLTVGRGSIGSEGFVTTLGSDVGAACARTALVGGPSCDVTNTRDLILGASTGVAASFIGFPCPSDGTPAGIGANVVGDVVTGGGRLRGETAATVSGVVDTTGTDARVATCNQARADMLTASATLAGLTPTRDLGTIRVVPAGSDTTVTVNADPGVNVWTAEAIILVSKTAGGEVHSSTLRIVLDPATESVVINVHRVKAGRYSQLAVTGDVSKVVLNLSSGGSVRNRAGSVDPWVVGGDASVSIKTNGETDSGPLGVFAERVSVLGAVVR